MKNNNKVDMRFVSFLDSLKHHNSTLVESIKRGYYVCVEAESDNIEITPIFDSGYNTDIEDADVHYANVMSGRDKTNYDQHTECLYHLMEAYYSNAVAHGWVTVDVATSLSRKLESTYSEDSFQRNNKASALSNAYKAITSWYASLEKKYRKRPIIDELKKSHNVNRFRAPEGNLYIGINDESDLVAVVRLVDWGDVVGLKYSKPVDGNGEWQLKDSYYEGVHSSFYEDQVKYMRELMKSDSFKSMYP